MSVKSMRFGAAVSIVAACLATFAACQTADLQATATFQTQVAQRVESSLTAAATPSLPPTHSPNPLPQTTAAPTGTPLPSDTPAPTATPSPAPRDVTDPTLRPFFPPENTPVTAIPTALPRIKQSDDVRNILLIGSDRIDSSGGYRADTMIIVSVNKTANSVTMLSIPRDLYVFIPQSRDGMGRINSVINVAINAPGGPIPLLEQTILYNLGVPIHYFARVDFDSFRAIVDALGGIDIPVTCRLEDYVLKDPSLDPYDMDNWEQYTVPAGIEHMDGDQALLYARLRQAYRSFAADLPAPSTPYIGIDFDRHRRQQEVLRAMFRKARDQNLILQAPALYQQFIDSVETDMTLGDVLQFAQLALALEDLNISQNSIPTPYVFGWTTPTDSARVLLPTPDEFYKYIQRVMTAKGSNRVSQTPFSIEIWNGSTWDDADALAAYNLHLAGLRVTVAPADRTDYAATTLIDYTTSDKGSPLAYLKEILHLSDANVVKQPDANSPVNFRLILGADFNSCPYRSATLVTPTP